MRGQQDTGLFALVVGDMKIHAVFIWTETHPQSLGA